eukprot:4270690-Pyramimonas_sp.AAC.1
MAADRTRRSESSRLELDTRSVSHAEASGHRAGQVAPGCISARERLVAMYTLIVRRQDRRQVVYMVVFDDVAPEGLTTRESCSANLSV